MEQPIIGIIANDGESASAYADAVGRSGGESRLVLPKDGPSPEEVLTGVSGLIVGGDERLPGEADDTEELPLLRSALEVDLPVLCIGRGMQHLNFALEGKAAPEVSGHADVEVDGEAASAYHRIYISPGSKLAAVVGSGGIVRVNSRHSLGVREPHKSPLLMASAYSVEDGVIEALESPSHRWVIGVQFHPERRKELPPHFDRLFQSLVGNAREDSSPESLSAS